jgi:hypothetical protein
VTDLRENSFEASGIWRSVAGVDMTVIRRIWLYNLSADMWQSGIGDIHIEFMNYLQLIWISIVAESS